jgi:hypothetical protein
MSSILPLSTVQALIAAEFCSFCDSSAPIVERYTKRFGACRACVEHLEEPKGDRPVLGRDGRNV